VDRREDDIERERKKEQGRIEEETVGQKENRENKGGENERDRAEGIGKENRETS